MKSGHIERPSCLLACHCLSLVITTLSLRISPGKNLGQDAQRSRSAFGKSLPIFGPLLASTGPEGLGVSWKIRAWESVRLGCEAHPFLLFPAV